MFIFLNQKQKVKKQLRHFTNVVIGSSALLVYNYHVVHFLPLHFLHVYKSVVAILFFLS